MIKIYKSKLDDSDLAKGCGFHKAGTNQVYLSNSELYRRLNDDQHGKCYLCDRRLVAATIIEHLRPKCSNKNLIKDWNNLVLCCLYCNIIKGAGYDGMLNPLKHSACRMIKQTYLEKYDVFCFIPVDSSNQSLQLLASLLDRIYNGVYSKEKQKPSFHNFHNYAMDEILKFDLLLRNYKRHKGLTLKNDIKRQLAPDAEFLGLKYWRMKDDPMLEKDFKEELDKIK